MRSAESADDLARSLATFFSEHLPLRTGASPHTILAYRDAWKLFLRFAATRAARSVPALGLTDLDVETVLAFLDSLESDRHNAVVTRNHRRTALQAFFRYLPSVAPEYLAQSHRILTIPVKRGPRRTVDYLERAEMETLLAQVDRRTCQGRRDYTLLAFLYNSGARVQEATDLRVSAVQLDRPYQVRLFGKGRKERVCPMWPETAALLRALLAERGVSQDATAPVFVNVHGRPLTRYGIRHIVNRHAAATVKRLPSLARKRIHPHTLRHSCAVHLLQAGVELNLIRSWLGHVSLETTQRYAEIDLAQKRRAIDAVTPVGKLGRPPAATWQHESILAWLERL
jgi:site-specific recombinase XerD